MRRTISSVAMACLGLATGCGDSVPQPYELDHARVLAVRVDPPAVQAGETSRIDVLVTDSSAMPALAEPAAYSVTLPPELVAQGAAPRLVRDDAGWSVTAPDASTLASIRAALGLPADAILPLPLAVRVETRDGELAAEKVLLVGASGSNPPAPRISIDATLRVGTTAMLRVVDADPTLVYRWFSSVGSLSGFTRPEAELDPGVAGVGTIAVVVRDERGGVAWSTATATVDEPVSP